LENFLLPGLRSGGISIPFFAPALPFVVLSRPDADAPPAPLASSSYLE
jgi:hypothetical protein